MNFFSVPKVTVFNEATGKDKTLEQMIWMLDAGYWGADNKYGDMFLIFCCMMSSNAIVAWT
jgi:hypothetical protein